MANEREAQEDLWILPEELRVDFSDPAEAVAEWQKAYFVLDQVADVVSWSSDAAWAAIRDAQQRVELELERARERAK